MFAHMFGKRAKKGFQSYCCCPASASQSVLFHPPASRDFIKGMQKTMALVHWGRGAELDVNNSFHLGQFPRRIESCWCLCCSANCCCAARKASETLIYKFLHRHYQNGGTTTKVLPKILIQILFSSFR